MKKTSIAWVILCLLSITLASAQDDDTIQYEHGLPITGEDSAQIPQRSTPPAESLEKVSAGQIPSKLMETLDENSLYKGWREHQLLLDRSSGLYWLHINNGKTIRSYAFRKDGHPMSVFEKDVSSN